MAYLSDIEIAQQCEMKHITEIAKKADVPILLVGLDFKEKKAKILELFRPSENEAFDIKYIKEKYLGITAKYPELFDLGLA